MVLAACGGTTRHPDMTDGGTTSNLGGSSTTAGVGGTNTNMGGNADAGTDPGGTGGSLVITDEPTPCTTAEGAAGILIKILPYPGSKLECVAVAQAGTADAACADDALIRCDPIDCYPAKMLSGCCRPDHTCGLLEQGFFSPKKPLGCVSKDAWIDHPDFVGHEVTAMSCGK